MNDIKVILQSETNWKNFKCNCYMKTKWDWFKIHSCEHAYKKIYKYEVPLISVINVNPNIYKNKNIHKKTYKSLYKKHFIFI